MAEMAAGDIDNEFGAERASAHCYEQRSRLDGRGVRTRDAQILVKAFADQTFKRAEEQVPDAVAELDDEKRGVLREGVAQDRRRFAAEARPAAR